ncbi:MAG: hypothetical protein ACK56F_16510 [bacterium]
MALKCRDSSGGGEEVVALFGPHALQCSGFRWVRNGPRLTGAVVSAQPGP